MEEEETDEVFGPSLSTLTDRTLAMQRLQARINKLKGKSICLFICECALKQSSLNLKGNEKVNENMLSKKIFTDVPKLQYKESNILLF